MKNMDPLNVLIASAFAYLCVMAICQTVQSVMGAQ